jgi:hypothetical protein
MTDASIPIECTIDATYNPGWMLEEKIFLAHFFLESIAPAYHTL